MPKIFVSAVIPAPVSKVWEKIRDFNALPQWHPFVADSRIEGGLSPDAVGCVRNFSLKDNGGIIRERLLTLSDVDYVCTYSILEAPLAVQSYVATMKLRPVTEGNQTYAQWSAEFQSPADREADTVATVTSVFQEGFKSLGQAFGG